MRDWIFISDFDGTLTDRDFYQMVIDRVMPTQGAELYRRWREGGMTLLAFLSAVFAGLGMTETELDRFIATIPFDETAAAFIRRVRAAGGDFLILSAGTGYYIERVLARRGLLDQVRIIANPGVYRDGGIEVRPETGGPFYSPLHGVDKAKAVSAQTRTYRRVYFAGDSAPDAEAAVLAAKAFAKDGLQRLLARSGHPFVPFSVCAEIEPHIEEFLPLELVSSSGATKDRRGGTGQKLGAADPARAGGEGGRGPRFVDRGVDEGVPGVAGGEGGGRSS